MDTYFGGCNVSASTLCIQGERVGIINNVPTYFFRKDKQEAKGIRADNRQKEMDLSKMYVDEFNLNIVVPLQQRVQKLESQIERLHDAIEGINSCPYRAECPVLSRMRKQPDGD